MLTLQASVAVTEKLASGTCLVSSSGRPPGPRGPPGRYSRRSLPLLKPLLLGRLVPSLQVGLQVRMLMLLSLLPSLLLSLLPSLLLSLLPSQLCTVLLLLHTSLLFCRKLVPSLQQFATVDLCLPGHCATCKLTVMPSFVQGYDVLLGDDWLFANKAILSYEGKTLSLSAAGKTAVTLPCPAVAAPKYVGQCSAVRPSPAFLINALKAKPELISATQASRWLLKGGRAVVALVMTEGSASASPGTPSDKDDPHIPAAIKAELQTLLNEYSDVFKPLTDTPPERPVGHTIPLVPDARPPVTPMYSLSKPEQEELKKQIKDYLSKGMIEPSSSPYAAPILFVQKKSGELRMCIDYRQLNKLTLRDQHPLPRIDDLFDRLSGCSVFSSLDLQAGYHQIRITPEDVPKTAFRTPEGHFQFKVLSFGLTNAPATFERVMNDAFAPVLGKCALVYLDDILVMSKSLPEHLQHLRLVFDLLRKNKLYAKMSKCEFMQLTLRFLGHVISAGAISVDPDKVRAIVDWPVPSSLTQLQSFLGAANFVRKFVHNFSAISAPLTDLCGKLSATFPWHSWPDHERLAFYELKAAVANVPMLRLPDHTQPFQVYCDASLQGVGAVLMQDGYPLAYLSKKLSSAEVNYTTGEQEMLALVTACKEWRCYLEGVPFTLFTDHKPLISLPTQKNLSRRQARWMELLSRFDFKLEYIPGPVNPADPLSRLITGPQEGATVCAMLTRRQAKLSCGGEGASGARALEANAPAAVTAKSSLTPEITENTADTSHNRDLVPLVTCTSDTSVHYPAAPAHPLGLSDQLIQGYRLDPAFNAEADLSSMYQDTHGLWRLTGKDKVVVPNDSELRNHILHEMHDAVYSGHVGISKTLERVSRVFWWNTMRADVRYYVSTCDACQRDKASSLKPGGLLNPLSIPDYRWESVSMDFITKLPAGSHGYDAICVFVDRLSKMVHFVPCREDLKARRFSQLFIDHVYKLHGMPAELISDRGSLFTSVFWREVMRRCGSKPALSSSYHPQSDGQTERYNRVLEEMLRHYISPTQSDWPDYLALAEFAVNNSWQESIQSTPFLVNTGQSPVTVGLRDLPYGGRCPSAHAFTRWWQDAVANARKCMAAAQSRQAAYANKARRDVEYKVGQKVLLSTKNLKLQPGKARKLIPRYVGPFEILLLVGAVAVKLDLPASMSRLHPVFHVSLIKPYTGTDVGFMPPPVTWMDETPVYYVERLLDHKGVKDNKASFYLVQWEGYDSTHNTWEPRSNLTDCDKVLAEYNAIHHLNLEPPMAAATIIDVEVIFNVGGGSESDPMSIHRGQESFTAEAMEAFLKKTGNLYRVSLDEDREPVLEVPYTPEDYTTMAGLMVNLGTSLITWRNLFDTTGLAFVTWRTETGGIVIEVYLYPLSTSQQGPGEEQAAEPLLDAMSQGAASAQPVSPQSGADRALAPPAALRKQKDAAGPSKEAAQPQPPSSAAAAAGRKPGPAAAVHVGGTKRGSAQAVRQPAGDSGDGMVETQPVRKRVAGSRRAAGSPAGPHAHGADGSSGVSKITKDATYFEVSVEKAAKALASAAVRKWGMRCHTLPEGQGLFIIPGLSHGDIVKSEKLPEEFKWDTPEEFCIAEVMKGLFKEFGTLPAPYNAYQRFKTLINEWVPVVL
ncbi:hypothetical protein QJQ45_002321 [Haematococcus lacustris]|nr:hypothetical protein QJQ45_002321 [Haematococcus lacustris]